MRKVILFAALFVLLVIGSVRMIEARTPMCGVGSHAAASLVIALAETGCAAAHYYGFETGDKAERGDGK